MMRADTGPDAASVTSRALLATRLRAINEHRGSVTEVAQVGATGWF